jgi:hypothetical protein
MAGDSPPPLDLEKLAQNLSIGFEALLEEVKDLAQREATLRKNLEVAKKHVSVPSNVSAVLSMTRNQISSRSQVMAT